MGSDLGDLGAFGVVDSEEDKTDFSDAESFFNLPDDASEDEDDKDNITSR